MFLYARHIFARSGQRPAVEECFYMLDIYLRVAVRDQQLKSVLMYSANAVAGYSKM